jgi:hypothetical protein
MGYYPTFWQKKTPFRGLISECRFSIADFNLSLDKIRGGL